MIERIGRPKRCAIYARSSDPDAIKAQFRLCRDYAERQEWLVIGAFQDVGSGVADDRPGYQRLLREADGGTRPFDVLLVADVTRLFRTVDELEAVGRRLRGLGINAVSVASEDVRCWSGNPGDGFVELG